MAKDETKHQDWAAVDRVIKSRMRDLKVSTAQLARETGLSETTIRYVGGDRGSESPLVAIAAVLGWPYDYLRNILHGEPEKNLPESRFRETLRSQLGPMREGIAALQMGVDQMERIIGGSTLPDDDADGSA